MRNALPEATKRPRHPSHLIFLKRQVQGAPAQPSTDENGTASSKERGGEAGGFRDFVCLVIRQPYIDFPDLGWATHEPCIGLGYATEAARAALRFWREDVGVEEIWAGAFPTNRWSLRGAEKISFVDGGTFKVRFPGGREENIVGLAWPGMERFEGNFVLVLE
jgi:RimJ/RimL family protein N-acetyltransferase